MPQFDPNGYIALLKAALDQGYHITPGIEALEADGPAMFLRHDVDFSLDCATQMGEAEAEIGVISTYYIMVSNDYYNIMDKVGRERLRKLSSLGHEVGLHWDSSTYPSDDPIAAGVQFRNELDLLSQIVGVPVKTASQHIPTDSPLVDVETHIELEAYSHAVRSRFAYVADSSMQWREKTPLHYISEKRDFQFNAHPVWWFSDGSNAEEKLRCAITRQNAEREQLLESFVEYMNRILANRALYDKKFKKERGWS